MKNEPLWILGVCNASDSGACLMRDGKIVAAVNEERFLRKKNVSAFPSRSIDYVLQNQGLEPHEIDWVGCGAWKGMDMDATLPRLFEDILYQLHHGPRDARGHWIHRLKVTLERDGDFKNNLLEGLRALGIPEDKILFCDHHYSHALTAFYCSPFEEAYVLTADGRGDFRSATLWLANRRTGLRLLDLATELASPGALYGFITRLLGFIPDRHEGKVTGLAAHGKMSGAYGVLKSGFGYDSESGRVRSLIGETYRPFVTASWPELASRLSSFSREDISFAAQKLLEETLIGFLTRHLTDHPSKSVNLCLAGGCLSNVKLNHELSRLAPVRNVYVFPQMGDGGNAVGGTIHAALSKSSQRYFPLPHVYLGPDYSDPEILAAFQSKDLSFQKVSREEKIEFAVESLRQGKLTAWFQGRMEYGPRALGSRSILAPASDPAIHHALNEKLQRSEFMPFAPVTIPEYAARCFVGWREDQRAAQFMTICYPCTPFLKERCPAVVHVDGSARPQVIFQEQNPEYYEVVKRYIDATGNPALINTSFNLHEEPIVNTPEEAVSSFLEGNIDVLIAGSYIVHHPGPDKTNVWSHENTLSRTHP